MTPGEHRGNVPHDRLTPDQVLNCWRNGDYKVHGYLAALLRAMKRVGWRIRIDNVQAFCEQWEIAESSFYRAKAKLISQGRLKEYIKGVLEIWIVENKPIPLDPTENSLKNENKLPEMRDSPKNESAALKNENQILKNESQILKNESTTLKNERNTPLNPIQSQPCGDLPDLFQIYSDLDYLSLSHPPNPESESESKQDESEAEDPILTTQIDTEVDQSQESNIRDEDLIQFVIQKNPGADR